ncbi:MAG: methylenetetrahydrofolate reductase C-terminal domain-containing protein [Dehalococcoidales bacterium]|nr:methylenetetrahydrofolate reductase C-terminal domain-containing protein [Dehalococcoidales bacterium]
MIVAEQKSLAEIRQMITPYQRVLILGCGTCMTVCNAGGEREVSFLHNALRLAESRSGNGIHTFSEYTVKRQCDYEFLDSLVDKIGDVDAILSLGCGIGVQAIAERLPDLPVLPGVNTSFMGMAEEWGVWDERCAACGDCILAETGGICPITRCTKGILNGPCAGTKNGKCEANKDMDCAWILIYKRLERLGQLDKMRRYYPLRNFRTIPRPRRVASKASIDVGEGNG